MTNNLSAELLSSWWVNTFQHTMQITPHPYNSNPLIIRQPIFGVSLKHQGLDSRLVFTPASAMCVPSAAKEPQTGFRFMRQNRSLHW